jgi:hypothetical protein
VFYYNAGALPEALVSRAIDVVAAARMLHYTDTAVVCNSQWAMQLRAVELQLQTQDSNTTAANRDKASAVLATLKAQEILATDATVQDT